MAPIPTRRVSLRGAMVLIAALAVGMPQSFWTLAWYVRPSINSSDGRVLLTWHNVLAIVSGLSPCLATVTIGLTALQWGRPRLTFRMLRRSPGLVACAVATIMVVAEAIYGIESDGFRSFDQYWLQWLPVVARNTGGAVTGAWLTLALSGRWRWGRDQLDRIGQIVGACWIIFFLLMFYDEDEMFYFHYDFL
jgi:hypothetical protein